MRTAAKKDSAGRLKPSERNKRCQLCEYREAATGTIANNRVGPKCLEKIERIASKAGFSVPVPEFTPFKTKQ